MVTDAGHVLRWENTSEAVIAGIEVAIGFPIGEKLGFNASLTHMTALTNKQNGQPLSLVPDYAVKARLDWYATDSLTATTDPRPRSADTIASRGCSETSMTPAALPAALGISGGTAIAQIPRPGFFLRLSS